MTAATAKTREIRLAAWLLRAAAAAFAVALFAGFASSARAECGDWLAESNRGMAGQHAMLPAGLPGHVPCNGPMCQKTPVAPAPVVPATVVERVDQLGIAMLAMAVDPLAGQFSLSLESDVHPAKGFLPRIEHPPRG